MTGDEQKSDQTNRVRGVVAIVESTEDSRPTHVVGVPDESEAPHDFEEAVEAAGHGIFNYLLLLAVMPAGISNSFTTSSMSYILPSAECDLQLTLFQKGMLNSAAYAGMIASAFFWGILSDTRGRRPLLIFGYSAYFISNALSSTSQSFEVLLLFKFISGCMICGPFVIVMTYFAEFHGAKHRSKRFLFARLSSRIGALILPALAWLIIPQSWSFTLFDGAFVYNSWRIFLLLCSIGPLLTVLGLFYFPESPRFLMSQGRNDEAMKVFQRMYSMNTGKAPETFPVKSLCHEVQKSKTEGSAGWSIMSVWDRTRNGWVQLKPLFQKPYVYPFLLVTVIEFGGILCMSTMRLWTPQLFTLIENFDHENHDPSSGPPNLCDMISLQTPANATVIDDSNSTITNTCVVTPVASRVYINSMIIAVTSIIGHATSGSVINLLGAKKLLLIAYAVPALCSFAINWAPNSDAILAISAIYMAFISVTGALIMSVIVELIPTSLRATAGSLTTSVGRFGAMSGNLLFPILWSAGCLAPFLFLGSLLLCSFVLSFFIPKPSPKLM